MTNRLSSFEGTLTVNVKPAVFADYGLIRAVLEKPKLRIKHPREIYAVYQTLNRITQAVHDSSIETLQQSWHAILKNLHGKKIYRVGMGVTAFDTSALIGTLNGQPYLATVSEVDLKNKTALKEIVQALVVADNAAFGTAFRPGFFTYLLQSPDARCFVAKNEKNEIVGTLWGFYSTRSDKTRLFHVWELSRLPHLPNAHIASKIIGTVRAVFEKEPIAFVSLNVDADHKMAQELYAKLNFTQVSPLPKADKISMVHQLSVVKESPPNPKELTRAFVMKTVPLFWLIIYELARRIILLFRKLYYC